MTAIARLGRKFVIRLVRPAGWARMCLLSPPYAVLTAALLFLPVRQWWIYRLASAMFRPTLARALRAFDDAVVLWAPGRIERDANVESQQPQRQFGGQINHRTPGNAIVQAQALGPSPTAKNLAQHGLYLTCWHRVPIRQRGKPSSPGRRRCIHPRCVANRPACRSAKRLGRQRPFARLRGAVARGGRNWGNGVEARASTTPCVSQTSSGRAK